MTKTVTLCIENYAFFCDNRDKKAKNTAKTHFFATKLADIGKN